MPFYSLNSFTIGQFEVTHQNQTKKNTTTGPELCGKNCPWPGEIRSYFSGPQITSLALHRRQTAIKYCCHGA